MLGKAAGSIKGAGAALKAGEGLADAGKILRYGEQGAQALKAAPQALSVADKALAATEANAKGAYSTLHGAESTIANANNAGGLLGKINKFANKSADQSLLSQSGGLTRGTADSAVRDVSKMRQLGYTDLNKMAEASPHITTKNGVIYNTREAMLAKGKPIDATTFKDVVAGHIGNNVALTPAETKNIQRLVEATTNKYKFAGEGGKFSQTSAANFNAAQRDIMTAAYKAAPNSAARTTLLDIGNSMREPLNESLSRVILGNAQKKAIIGELSSRGIKNPGLTKAIMKAETGADLAAIEAPFVTASKMAEEGAASELRAGAKMFNPDRRKVTGMVNEAVGSVVGQPVRRGIAGGTNLISKMTMGAEKALPTTVDQ